MAKTATAKAADVPQETPAQRTARIRAEQRAQREKVRKVFDANESITDLDELAEKAGVDRSTAHNALDAPRFRTMGRRARTAFKASVRAAYKAQRPDDLYEFARQFGNQAGAREVEEALTKPQRTAMDNRAKRRHARERRAQERADAREQAADDRLRERFERKSRTKAKVALLPVGAKPTKVSSNDETRPVLTRARITRIGRGENKRWLLDVTDSYRLARFPLEVCGDAGLKDGLMIPAEALKRIEKEGGFRIVGNVVKPVDAEKSNESGYGYRKDGTYGSRDGFPRHWTEVKVHVVHEGYEVLHQRKVGAFPNFRQLVPKAPPKSRRIVLCLDPQLLSQLADAIDEKAKAKSVSIVIDTKRVAKNESGRYVNGAFLVEAREGREEIVALQMPVRPA